MVKGMGGAMDLVAGAKKVIVAIVNLIMTELAVIEVTPRGLVLKEIASDTTLDAVRHATGAELVVDGPPAVF